MPLAYQKHILRKHLQANPDIAFVFGDNARRKGLAGQAAQMRGEPNAIGVVTKWEPSFRPEAFFSDDDFDWAYQQLTCDLKQVHDLLIQGKLVIWPMDGIGTGLSNLPRNAPRIWTLLEETRLELEKL